MTTNPDDSLSAADARDSRRWLIGVGISLAFGLFGVVMALLAYSEQNKGFGAAPRQNPYRQKPRPGGPQQGRSSQA